MADERKQLANDIAGEIIPAFISALKQTKDGDTAVVLATLTVNQQHLEDTVNGLKKVVYEQHEPVILWSRNFMDSYRKIVMAVTISGLITLLGFLVQVYYLLQKSK